MGGGHLTDPETTTRRDLLLGSGILTVVGGTAGCLGFGDDDEETGKSENETDVNGSEDTSTEPDGERNETADTESPDDNQSNDTGSHDAEGSEPEDDDSSILEEEPNDNESDDGDENDSEGDQADFDNESNDNETDVEEENDTGNETQENDTAEEAKENLDNDSNESSGGDENGSESNQDTSEEEEEREFEQIIIEELSYQVDYPADWEMVETDESIPVVIANSDETAWIWIDIRETSLDLEGDITNYRQNFEPHPEFEIHEDEPMTLSSGEDGHRFVIEVSENPENPLFAHELLANEHGNEYLTSVQVSRPEYDEEYAELAEEILASVTLL